MVVIIWHLFMVTMTGVFNMDVNDEVFKIIKLFSIIFFFFDGMD